MDLGRIYYIDRLETKGRVTGSDHYFVDSFTISYSSDGQTPFARVIDENGEAIVFWGNTDGEGLADNTFEPGLTAQYVQLHPVGWENSISLRWEIYGCLGMTSDVYVHLKKVM